METQTVRLCALSIALAAGAWAAELHALPEHERPDPYPTTATRRANRD